MIQHQRSKYRENHVHPMQKSRMHTPRVLSGELQKASEDPGTVRASWLRELCEGCCWYLEDLSGEPDSRIFSHLTSGHD